MAQSEIPIVGTVPEVGDNGETGYQLRVGGGDTLPFTEEQLRKQGYEISQDGSVVKKADIVITGKLANRPEEGAPEGVIAQGAPDVTQPAPDARVEDIPVETSPAEQAQVSPDTVAPEGPELVSQQPPMELSPAEVAPEDLPSIPGVSQAQAAPAQGQPAFANVSRIVDEAIASTGAMYTGKTRAGAEQALSPEDVKERGVDLRPILLPKEMTGADLPPDYYTKMFFTDVNNPSDATESPQDFTIKLHDRFRNAVGFRKPLYDPELRQFARDEDNQIIVDESPLGLIKFDSEDLDERTAQFIREGGYFLQEGDEFTLPDGSYNGTFPGDILDAEILQRGQELDGLLSTPIFRYMSEKGGASRVAQVFEANGVPLADQVYSMRRLATAPLAVTKDMSRIGYTIDNGYGGFLEFVGLAPNFAIDQTAFLASWMIALGSEVPEVMMSIIQAREADAPVTKSIFLETDPAADVPVNERTRQFRSVLRSLPMIEWAANMGWDATQRYAEDSDLNYEQARAGLMANRGFFDLVQWFAVENAGFSGPLLARRAHLGGKAASALDNFILETYATAAERKLYQLAGTSRGAKIIGSGVEAKRTRFDIIQDVLIRVNETDGKPAMDLVLEAFRESKHFQALNRFQQRTFGAFWTREGYLAQRANLPQSTRSTPIFSGLTSQVESERKGAFAIIKELQKDRDEKFKAYKKLRQSSRDLTEVNKARSELLAANRDLASAKAIGILPKELKALTQGEFSATVGAATGYAFAYENFESPSSHDWGSFLALTSFFAPSIANAGKDAMYGSHALLYKLPGVKQAMDKFGIAPPAKEVRDAVKILTENADPQVAAFMQTNLDAVGQTIIMAEELNRKAEARGGKPVINSKLFILGLAQMAGINGIDAAIARITANPKMAEVLGFGDEVRDIHTALNQKISLRNQLANAVKQLRVEIDGLPPEDAFTANILSQELEAMESFVKYQDEVFSSQLELQSDLWYETGQLLEDVLNSGRSNKYLGTQLEEMAQEAAAKKQPLDIMRLVDTLLSRDNLVAAGMSEEDIARVGRSSTIYREYLARTDTGLKMLNDAFDKTLVHLAEFRENMPEGIGQFSVNWISSQRQITSNKFMELYGKLDADFADHRMSVTTPYSFTNDKGEVVTIKSIYDFIDNGEFMLAGVTDELAKVVGGKNVNPEVAAFHGLMEEGATATVRDLRRNVDGASEAFDDYIARLNVQRMALEQPLLDPTKMTGLQKWKYMGEALVDLGIVESFDAYKATTGRIGIKAKDYRVLISKLGAGGAVRNGFAQYSHNELRARFVQQGSEFESNFFDVNRNQDAPRIDGQFKARLNSIGEMYVKESLNPFRDDKYVSQMLTAIENGQDYNTNDFFQKITSRYGLDTEEPDIAGFQKFWARFGGVRNEAGEYVIDLDTAAGKQIQQILQHWGTSLLVSKKSIAGQRAVALRYNAALDIRAAINSAAAGGDRIALAQMHANQSFYLPKDLPKLQEGYQKDLPWNEWLVLENIRGVATVNGKKVEVPLVSLDAITKPIMPENMEGGRMGDWVDLVRGTNQSRVKAVATAKQLIRDEQKIIKDKKTRQGIEMDMYTKLWSQIRGKTPEETRANMINLIASGPAGAKNLKRFKDTYINQRRAQFIEENPNATGPEIAEVIATADQSYKDLLRNLAIDYLFDIAASPGPVSSYTDAAGGFVRGNPAELNGQAIFAALGLETSGLGLSDRGKNFQEFFAEVGASDVLDDIRFLASNLFEAGPQGNIRIQNLPTPINLNHVATRVVAGLRGQVSPRWLIIEHVLRRKAIEDGETFLKIMMDPEIGEQLVELATNRDLSPKQVDASIGAIYKRIWPYVARSEYFEQEWLPTLQEASFALGSATAPSDDMYGD